MATQTLTIIEDVHANGFSTTTKAQTNARNTQLVMGDVYRSYFRLAEPTLGAGEQVQSIQLNLVTTQSNTATTLRLYAVNAAWSESTLTYNNMAGVTLIKTVNVPALGANAAFTIDVTGVPSANGLAIDSPGLVRTHSLEATNAAYRPTSTYTTAVANVPVTVDVDTPTLSAAAVEAAVSTPFNPEGYTETPRAITADYTRTAAGVKGNETSAGTIGTLPGDLVYRISPVADTDATAAKISFRMGYTGNIMVSPILSDDDATLGDGETVTLAGDTRVTQTFRIPAGQIVYGFRVRALDGGSGNTYFSEAAEADRPTASTYAIPVPVHTTVDADTATGSAQAFEAAAETVQNSTIDLTSVSASVTAADPVVETSVNDSVDLDTPTATAGAVEATAEVSDNPTVVVDVETATAAANALDADVTVSAFVDVSETGTADVDAYDPSVEVFNNAEIELDTPSAQVGIVRLTDVNGEPIVPSETEDPYFVSTLRSVDTGDIWWRLNEAQGVKVFNRANPASEWPASGTGNYDGVTIGQFNGPEGRRSVYFNGTALIEENEPTSSNADEVFYSPNSLEFTFRTERGTQFIMGGADQSGGTSGNSPVEASEFWLVDGRINFRAYRLLSGVEAPQVNTNITGFTNLADGRWHHIVVNAGISNAARGSRAIEIYVDGKLEIRRFAGVTGTSANETTETAVVYFGMPDYIGGRGEFMDQRRVPPLATGNWFLGDMTEVVFRNRKTLSVDQILLQRDNMFGIRPVYVETPRIRTKAVEASAKGNKVRVLVIDFQTASAMTLNQTYDGIGPKPGHDAFGRLLNAPPYTAAFNFEGLRSALGDTYGVEAYQFFSVPVRNNYTDRVTDNERLLDLDVDVNMDDYDILAIGGYPLDDTQMQWFTGMDEYSTAPFVPARTQLQNLMTQIRQKAIAGKRLFVNDPGSAVALGIVDRVEYVPVMRERVINDYRAGSEVNLYDQRAAVIDPWNRNVGAANADRYRDEHANQMQRVRATIEGLTTLPSYIITDYIEWYNVDPMASPPMQQAMKVEDRTTGLSIGDEFYLNGAQGPGLLDGWDEADGSPTTGSRASGWVAAPMANVKAGTVVTSFGSKVYNLDRTEANPYKDYAVSIVIKPGDQWAGQTVGGKVYCNFTEAWTHYAPFFETLLVQNIPADEQLPGIYRNTETAETREWDYSTYRGTWTGTTVNPNQGSGAGDISTNATSGAVSSSAGTSTTKKPNVTTLVTYTWQSRYPLEQKPNLSMAHRGLRWLATDVDNDGNANVSVETAEVSVKAEEATATATRSEVVDLSTARVTTEAFTDANTVARDATVLVPTAASTVIAGAFREAIDLTTARVAVAAVEPESDLLQGRDIIRLTLPRHAITLYMEER